MFQNWHIIGLSYEKYLYLWNRKCCIRNYLGLFTKLEPEITETHSLLQLVDSSLFLICIKSITIVAITFARHHMNTIFIFPLPTIFLFPYRYVNFSAELHTKMLEAIKIRANDCKRLRSQLTNLHPCLKSQYYHYLCYIDLTAGKTFNRLR